MRRIYNMQKMVEPNSQLWVQRLHRLHRLHSVQRVERGREGFNMQRVQVGALDAE